MRRLCRRSGTPSPSKRLRARLPQPRRLQTRPLPSQLYHTMTRSHLLPPPTCLLPSPESCCTRRRHRVLGDCCTASVGRHCTSKTRTRSCSCRFCSRSRLTMGAPPPLTPASILLNHSAVQIPRTCACSQPSTLKSPLSRAPSTALAGAAAAAAAVALCEFELMVIITGTGKVLVSRETIPPPTLEIWGYLLCCRC
jgi:hypothetical protein